MDLPGLVSGTRDLTWKERVIAEAALDLRPISDKEKRREANIKMLLKEKQGTRARRWSKPGRTFPPPERNRSTVHKGQFCNLKLRLSPRLSLEMEIQATTRAPHGPKAGSAFSIPTVWKLSRP